MIKNIMDNLEHVPPAVLKKVLSGCLWEGEPESGVLSLTFDDGPDPQITPAVLDVLDEIQRDSTALTLGSVRTLCEFAHLCHLCQLGVPGVSPLRRGTRF